MMEVSHIQKINLRLLLLLQEETIAQIVRVGAPAKLLQATDGALNQVPAHTLDQALREPVLSLLRESGLKELLCPVSEIFVLLQHLIDCAGQLSLLPRGLFLRQAAKGIRQIVQSRRGCHQPLQISSPL